MSVTSVAATLPPAPLFRLTDEELRLLGAADEVDTPYLDRLDPGRQALAADVAYRSLCAHGVCAAQGGGLLVPDELVQLLQVRSAPERAYRIELRDQGARSLRYLYQAGGTTVCEDVSYDGIHDFDVLPATQSGELMAAVLTPPLPPVLGAAVPRGGCRTTDDLRLLSEPAPWGQVLATADVTERAAGCAEQLVSVIWGDAGTYLVSTPVQGSPPDEGVADVRLVALIADQLGIDRAS